tara:strand:+ start:184 stop:603 length:420 start_codon:yes stop_codon:yes gene_type:complete
MATITPKLTINSTTAITGETLNISVDDTLTVVSPIVGLSVVDAEATSGSLTTIKPSGSANQYVYVKHTGYQADGTTATTNQLAVFVEGTDTDGDTNTIETLRLAAQEFAFFPVMSNKIVKVKSSSTHVVKTEYAYWTAG